MTFCTVINCMDGRVQLPVITYLKKRFDVEYVDTITEPGPTLILAEQQNLPIVQSIFKRVSVSVKSHHSAGIAVVGHYDCAGNPAPEDDQRQQIQEAAQLIRRQFDNMDVIGLWVDDQWSVHEVVTQRVGKK
ncbi:MAG: hypothetical protein K8S27_09635 [Candidatus Omnitrophica bacterium]|nr:hypothetical protein [Candidatus Omnitrophota bacterium]